MVAGYDSYKECILGGMAFRLRNALPDQNLRTFQNRVTFGEPTEANNPLLSSYTIADLSGGHGVDDLSEQLDAARYWYGSMYTRYPFQITKSYQVSTKSLETGSVVNYRFYGDIKNLSGDWKSVRVAFVSGQWEVYFAAGSAGQLTVEPVNKGVVYRGTSTLDAVIIPLGAAGYATVEPDAVLTEIAADGTHPAIQAVAIWSDILVAIDIDGQLWHTTDATGAWTSYGSTAKLPASYIPLNLEPYFDRGGNPTLFIITDTDLWQANLDVPAIFTVDVSFPPHPYHGLAMTKWSGDLFFSVGMGIHRYTGGSLVAIGLDRDQGLPVEYNGHVVQGGLVSGYNGLYAFVQTQDLSSETFPDGMPIARYSIHEWTGSGWHQLYEGAADKYLVPYSMAITRSNYGNGHALIWGEQGATSGSILKMDLPITFSNPRQRSRMTGGFQANGYLYTARFDAGMKGYRKIANAIDIDITNMHSAAELNVSYWVDNRDDLEIALGTIIEPGRHTLPFGEPFEVNDTLIYPGVDFENIRFKYDLIDGSNDAFVMRSAAFSFQKTLPPSNSWTADIDLTVSGPGGNSPNDMLEHLDALFATNLYTYLTYRRQTYRVSVTANNGTKEGGTDERAFRRVSILEVPLTFGNLT